MKTPTMMRPTTRMDGIFSNDEKFDDDESDSSSDSDDEDQENLPSTVVAICIRNERTG
jgi:hypothetical protein